MNCDTAKCPHGALMDAAHCACRHCGRTGSACNERECPARTLLAKARKACLDCNHLTPAGKGGTISADAAGERVVQREALYIDRSPRGQMTTLPFAQEEAVGELFRRFTNLDTVDALLLLHSANGGRVADFGAYLQRVASAIDSYNPARPAFRATAWNKWQRIVQRIPLADKLRRWSDGHGGAKPGQGKGREHKFTDASRDALRQQRKEERQQVNEEKAQRLAERLAQRIQRQNQHWLERLQRQGAAWAERLAKIERKRREREAARAARLAGAAGGAGCAS